MYQVPSQASEAIKRFVTGMNGLMTAVIAASELEGVERVAAFVGLAEEYEAFTTQDAIALAMAK